MTGTIQCATDGRHKLLKKSTMRRFSEIDAQSKLTKTRPRKSEQVRKNSTKQNRTTGLHVGQIFLLDGGVDGR